MKFDHLQRNPPKYATSSKAKALVTQWCPALCNPMNWVAYQVPSGLSFPSPGEILDPGIEPRSSAFQADSLPLEPPGELQVLKQLTILFNFSKNQLLALLIFTMVSFVSFACISALILKISFLLLTLGFLISSFSSCFRCRARLFDFFLVS